MMQVVFVIVEFKISNFFAVIEDNNKSPVFSVSGKFFAWEQQVTIYLYTFQINHKPSVPQMGATEVHF